MTKRRDWSAGTGTASTRGGSTGSQRQNPDLQSQTVNGVSYNASGAATEDPNAYYSEILARFNQGDMSLEELYQALGYGLSGNNMSTEQREDFLKQLIDSMLAKRQLDEQRSYDNPSNVLQRLLAAGVSPDVARSAIAGGAGSSGSGGSSPLIGAAQAPAPSESYLNEVSAKTSISNTALNALQCAASVASFGISIPGQIANNTISQVSAEVTSKAQTALEGVNAGVNALNSCVQLGLISQDDADQASTGSRTLDAALQYCAKKDPNSPAAQFIASPQYQELTSNPYASKVASDRYIDQRSGGDYAMTMAYEFKARRGAEMLTNLDIEKTSAEIAAIWAEHESEMLEQMLMYYDLENVKPAQVKQILADANAKQAQASLSNQELSLFGLKRRNWQLQNNLLGANINSVNLQAEYSRQLTRGLRINNDLFQRSLDSSYKDPISGKMHTGEYWLTMSMLGEYANSALTYYGLLRPEYRNNYIKAMQKDVQFQATDMTLKWLYQSDALRYYTDKPQDWYRFIHGTQFIFRNPVTGSSTGTSDMFKLTSIPSGKPAPTLRLGK